MDAASWLEWWTGGRVVAAATVGQLVVVGWAALYARVQVREARELRKDQARPFVVVDLERDRHPLVNLVVANLGRTMARNVRIAVDPPLQSTVYDSGEFPIGNLKLFTEPIPSLAPDKRIVLLFDSVPHRFDAGLPDSYRVRVAYEWDGGEPLSEELRLDLDLYRPLRQVHLDTVHDVSKTLQEIRGQLKRWSAGSEGGLLVLSPEDRRRRVEDALAGRRAFGPAAPAADDGQGDQSVERD